MIGVRFESELTRAEIGAILQERTQQYSFYNLHLPDTILGHYKNNRFVLWKTKRADSFYVTKLANAFYGKITTVNGKTVLSGHFRLGNYDLVSWMVVFVLYLAVVFAATAGTLAERLINMGVMSLVWCVICAAAVLAESLLDRPQKREVVAFIKDNLLKREIHSETEERDVAYGEKSLFS